MYTCLGLGFSLLVFTIFVLLAPQIFKDAQVPIVIVTIFIMLSSSVGTGLPFNGLMEQKIFISQLEVENTYTLGEANQFYNLEAFKNKVNDMLLTHEIRINNNIKDIANFSSKYDKIISENFLVPGFVGPSCQYKTLSEYIIFNINT